MTDRYEKEKVNATRTNLYVAVVKATIEKVMNEVVVTHAEVLTFEGTDDYLHDEIRELVET